MKKHVLTLCLLLLGSAMGVNAQNATAEQAKKDFVQNTKFGGYVIGRAAFNSKDLSGTTNPNSNFDLRLIRGYVDGKVLDFAYKLQVEYEGYGGTTEKGPHVIDAWGEWQKYTFFRIKVGQFKRCFTFENPMNPWDISWGDYSQVVTKMAGFSDRCGEVQSNGGRDGGIQFQGDLLPSKKDGHAFLHYQLGVYNGQGINHNDMNNNKDLIGNIQISPIKDLTIAAFGWTGKYTYKYTGNVYSSTYSGTADLTTGDVTGNGDLKVESKSVCHDFDRNRYGFGIKYSGPVKLRAEYVVSEGHKVNDFKLNKECTVLEYNEKTDYYYNDGSDAWYATAIVPTKINKKEFNVQARWDVYRDAKSWETTTSKYGLGAEYYFCKNLKLQANYYYVNDKNVAATSNNHHYNAFDMQLYWRW